MAQKILAGRTSDASLSQELVPVKVDQIALSRDPRRALAEGLAAGLKKFGGEVAVAYERTCASDGRTASTTFPAMLAHGILVGRAGVGFAGPVHLERFASPARLCVTDDPRLALLGGVGMLTLVVSPAQLGQALAQGTVLVRPPRSVHVQLSGRVRPFVCARDVALELLRRGVGEVVRKVEAEHGAPVVLEFGGPSVRLLSVGERAVLAGLAPQIGAAAAIFSSDERTEVFLRDQRRSKAHRALAPDAGAPVDEVVAVDLAGVDPLLLDEQGQVRAVRDLAGKPVAQALLGGDGGVTLRDLFAAALLLKSKRVPSRLDFLLAVPSRQMLEVLASEGPLADLVATGARLVEPDARIASGALYPPPAGAISLRTCDPEPRVPGRGSFVVGSAETLAYAVATGEIGDPRSFKRPVRVTVPRTLPTDDVLVLRERKASELGEAKASGDPLAPPVPWRGGETLDVVAAGAAWPETGAFAVLCATLDELREAAARAPSAPGLRAVLAPMLPPATVTFLSGLGVLALRHAPEHGKALGSARSLALPAPSAWGPSQIVAAAGVKVPLAWPALAGERAWVLAGGARAPRK
jgi:aconitate hydratase